MDAKFVFSVINFRIDDGIKIVDKIDKEILIEYKSADNKKEFIDKIREILEFQVKENILNYCIKNRDKYFSFGKEYFDSQYKSKTDNKIEKLVEKIEKLEEKIKELEKNIK